MQCLQLTRGEPPATTVDVVLSGKFSSSNGYVTIDGTKYTSAQTLTVAKGTSVTVHCGYAKPVSQTTPYIKLNGTKVAQGASGAAAEYTFDVTDNCSIVVTLAVDAYIADITMPA